MIIVAVFYLFFAYFIFLFIDNLEISFSVKSASSFLFYLSSLYHSRTAGRFFNYDFLSIFVCGTKTEPKQTKGVDGRRELGVPFTE